MFVQRADAEIRGVSFWIDHRAKRLIWAEALAEVGVHQRMPVVDGEGDAALLQKRLDTP
ncbi:hypothetical protein SDC9_56681 [bioreactor metagenome]|uniref:Uncharacterized protein n=1 Tax=bioreactor metagenome TaxID=1076179 RepID=A0A644X2I1_9ZZZZ